MYTLLLKKLRIFVESEENRDLGKDFFSLYSRIGRKWRRSLEGGLFPQSIEDTTTRYNIVEVSTRKRSYNITVKHPLPVRHQLPRPLNHEGTTRYKHNRVAALSLLLFVSV